MHRRELERSLAYVDSWLGWRIPRSEVPGCAVAVSLAGRLLLEAGYGQADVATGRALRGDDVFRVASHSKSFTATAVLQLVEMGRLRLDDPAALHLDWLLAHDDPRFRRVTLRQLLCHGAGVVRDGTDADYWQLRHPFPTARSLQRHLSEASLVTEPNVALKYSNYGYGLVGMVIEAVTGEPYHDYVNRSIVEPLGLVSTEPELSGKLAKRSVTGYGPRDEGGQRRPVPPVDTRALAAATGFASNGADLCRYFDAHFVGSRKLLSDESKREMQRVHWHVHRAGLDRSEDYGLGLSLEVLRGHRTIGHGGGFPGQITRTIADPDERLVVVVLTNCIDGPALDIARAIYGIIDHFQAHAGEPVRRGLRRLEGRYSNLWSTQDVIVAGGAAWTAEPGTWAPLGDPDRLEVVDGTTLRIADTSSYGSAGELVRFEISDGKVGMANWAGMTVWPADAWPKAERALLRPNRRRS